MLLEISWLSLIPDSKAHGANMGPIWGQHDPVGAHVGPMNYAIWVYTSSSYVLNHEYGIIYVDFSFHVGCWFLWHIRILVKLGGILFCK